MISPSLTRLPVLLAACLLGGSIPALAQTTVLGSASSTGAFPSADCGSAHLSEDGRYLLFGSAAPDVVPGDTNAVSDVFVRDLQTGMTERISVAPGGAQLTGDSYAVALAASGRFVVYSSTLHPLVSSTWSQLFVYDRTTGVTELLSANSAGVIGDFQTTGPADITRDGRFVAFVSEAGNLAPNGMASGADVFLRDRASGTTQLVSVALGGAHPNGQSTSEVAVSADGRFVAFSSQASNLVAGDTNATRDVFVRDMIAGTTERVSLTDAGGQAQPANVNQGSGHLGMSADGRFVAFWSSIADLVPGIHYENPYIYVRDRRLSTTRRVSVTSWGGSAPESPSWPAINADGRWIVFLGDWLAAGDVNGYTDAILRDVQTGTTQLASFTSTGSQLGSPGVSGNSSCALAISGDGRHVAFISRAANVVPGSTGQFEYVYVRTLPPIESFTTYCLGDGSGAACPCSNTSLPGNQEGCNHSFGYGGKIYGNGIADATADSFVLVGDHMPNGPALFFQGTARVQGGLGTPFGDGLRCVGGTSVRLAIKTNVNTSSMYPEPGDPQISQVGGLTPGDVRMYQVWFRNSWSFCTSDTFNLTNAIQVVW
jgi:Tol biopolymer transport system component